MKKTILNVVAIGSLAVLTGCSQPDSKKTYAANQKVYSCGAYEVILESRNRTVYGTKVTGRDTNGLLKFKDTSKRVSGSITIDSWAMKPYTTDINGNGSFRMDNKEMWSFGKINGEYLLCQSRSCSDKSLFNRISCKRIR